YFDHNLEPANMVYDLDQEGKKVVRYSFGGENWKVKPGTTNCVIATIEAFSYATGGTINGASVADAQFYGLYDAWVLNPSKTNDVVTQLVKLGIGVEVKPEDMRAGD